jgi:hypothetical protein
MYRLPNPNQNSDLYNRSGLLPRSPTSLVRIVSQRVFYWLGRRVAITKGPINWNLVGMRAATGHPRAPALVIAEAKSSVYSEIMREDIGSAEKLDAEYIDADYAAIVREFDQQPGGNGEPSKAVLKQIRKIARKHRRRESHR